MLANPSVNSWKQKWFILRPMFLNLVQIPVWEFVVTTTRFFVVAEAQAAVVRIWRLKVAVSAPAKLPFNVNNKCWLATRYCTPGRRFAVSDRSCKERILKQARFHQTESSPRDGCPSSPVPQRKASVSSDSNHSDSGKWGLGARLVQVRRFRVSFTLVS